MPTACRPAHRWPRAWRPALLVAAPLAAALPLVAALLAAAGGLAVAAHAQVTDAGGDTAPAAASGPAAAPAPASTAPVSTAPASTGAPGSVRAAVAAVLPGTNQPVAGATTAPAWIVTSALSLQEGWTDNALQTSTNRVSSPITQIAPSISINGSTARLAADLYYSPSLLLYTSQSGQNQIGQNLGADATLTILPEEFSIAANGYAAVQSLTGGMALPGTAAVPLANQVQTYDFSIEPYLTHRFGGWGSLQIGASASQATAGAVGGGAAFQSLTATQEFATLTSGENFGRLSSTLAVSAAQDTGSGALQGAVQNLATYQAGYAITRGIVALGSIGWEDIAYGGPGAPRYNDATWSFGVKLIPNADSGITVSYGHQQGVTAAAVNATYVPTPHIVLTAQYAASVDTAAQALNSALTGASFDAQGHPISAQTGQPLLPANNFFGYNGAVYRSKILTLGASWLRPRDAFQLGLTQQTQTPLGNNGTAVLAVVPNTAAGTLTETAGLAVSSGTFGTVAWQHDLSQAVSTTLSAQYGVLGNATPLTLSNGAPTATGKQVQNVRLVAFGAGVTWLMSPTLTGTVQYSYTSNDYGAGVPGMAANLVVLGLNKTF